MLGAEPPGAASLIVQPIGSLHRLGTWPRALMIGEPSPWDWHRLLSGLAPSVEILTLGKQSAAGCASSIASLRSARDHWGGVAVRERTWRTLVGRVPPVTPAEISAPRRPVLTLDGAEYALEPDPFEELASLFDLQPLNIGGEGPSAVLAREDDDGTGPHPCPRSRSRRTRGRFSSRSDTRSTSETAQDRRALPRTPRTRLDPLGGALAGRVGLLEALEERLGDRPDLLAARFLLGDYRRAAAPASPSVF
jgi:hypothetical protein